ncbi:MAG TPA: ABC transporter permease subunit [Clostridia bacterium]|nr:ABC transporter permease subunit [Clostridia bacterium]
MQPTLSGRPTPSFAQRAARDFARHRIAYLMFVPVLAYYILFHYAPMYGAVIAFKNFIPSRGIWASPWAGLKHFQTFFGSYYFGRLLRNTLLISVYSIAFGFPAPILLALLFNELKSSAFKRTVQTITYLPHFISLMVICGMLLEFLSTRGLINDLIAAFGGNRVSFFLFPEYFRPIYIASDIWQGVGWGSIVYLAALSGIDPALYEAARIDGASRLRQAVHITLPGIMPTIVVLFILRLGNLMSVGHEKIILLYNELLYETADVISTFVYRKGLISFEYSYSSAVGLFNSLINFALVVTANWISRTLSETSLW